MAIIQGAQSITEDFSRVGGFIAGCGQASAYVIAHIIKGEPLSTNELTQIIKNSIDAGKATVRGSQPIGSQYVLSQFGISSQVKNVAPNQLGAFLNNELAQNVPVEIGLNQGHFLSNEQSNLHGHYVTIVGSQNGKYVTADPNAPQSKTGGFTLNTLQQFLDAQPFAEIIPTGAGPGSTNNCGSPPDPSKYTFNIADPQYQIALAKYNACQAANTVNAANSVMDIPSAIAALPQNITSSISGGISDAIKNEESKLGISGPGDIGWRIILTLIGFTLMIWAIIFIGFDLLDKSNIEVAGSRV